MHSSVMSFSESGIANRLTGQKDKSPRPYLRVSSGKGSVTLEFDMDLQESILIYCKRGHESDFVLLTEAFNSPFIDLRPNHTEYSETREYKAIYSKNGEPVGEEDILKVRTKGRFRFF